MTKAKLLLKDGHRDAWSPWVIPLSQRAGWWVAADHGIAALMTDDGSGLISSWKARNTFIDFTAATTNRATWSSTAFASTYNGLTFDGSSDAMTLASTTGLPTGSTIGTICVLGTPAAAGVNQNVVTYGGTANGSLRRIRISVSNTINVGDGTTNTPNSGVVTGNPAIMIGVFDSTVYTTRYNGSAGTAATGATLNTSTTRSRLCSDTGGSPGTFMTGVIAEWMVISGTVDTTLMQKIEGYWAWNYPAAGLVARLPASHPYKNGPP